MLLGAKDVVQVAKTLKKDWGKMHFKKRALISLKERKKQKSYCSKHILIK